MFQKIPMIRFDWVTPRTPTNKSAFSDFSYSFPEDAQNALNSDFKLDGTQKFIQPHPVSAYASTHFLYLQSFVYLESKSAYFTRRSNYDSFLLSYTYDGSGILEYEKHIYTLTPGSGFLIDCRIPHYYHTESDYWTHGDIHFNGINADYFFDLWKESGNVTYSISFNEFQEQIEKLLYDYVNFSMERDLLVSSHLECLLLNLLCHKKTVSKSTSVPENILYLIKYMESNYTLPLSLDSLADFSGLSKYHLSREFKRYTGKSPNEYLIELRLSNAKFLLSSTMLPCYRIGELSGIQDFNNFVRLFKKETGYTPTQYRKRVNEYTH